MKNINKILEKIDTNNLTDAQADFLEIMAEWEEYENEGHALRSDLIKLGKDRMEVVRQAVENGHFVMASKSKKAAKVVVGDSDEAKEAEKKVIALKKKEGKIRYYMSNAYAQKGGCIVLRASMMSGTVAQELNLQI